MRAFVALEVSEEVLDSLSKFQAEISSTGCDLKLVERENLHFTVKFLGEITEGQATEALTRLGELRLGRTEAEVQAAGAFPSANRPRVVWAGVAKQSEPSMNAIANRVIQSLDGIGEKDDRPFQAHITLGRVRSDRNIDRLTELLAASSQRTFGTSPIGEVKLKSSLLTPNGPIYKDVGVFPLV